MHTADVLPRGRRTAQPAILGVRMCGHIRFTARVGASIYDSDTGVITLPSSIADSHRGTAVRAVLTELDVVQPELGAVCWCGEPVTLLPRVPQQRRSGQVIKHGA